MGNAAWGLDPVRPGKFRVARADAQDYTARRGPCLAKSPSLERLQGSFGCRGPTNEGNCSSAPRMVLFVQAFQALPGHLGINLRRRQIAVAQEHLDHPKVGAAVDQMRGE